MGIKISALTETTSPAGADYTPVLQGGQTKKTTLANLFSNILITATAWLAEHNTNGSHKAITATSLIATGDIATTAWTDFNPNIAVSGGTVPTFTGYFSSRYRVVGKVVQWQISWINTVGGTAGSGANPIIFTLPVAVSANVPVTPTHSTCIGNGYVNSEIAVGISVMALTTTTAQFWNMASVDAPVSGNNVNNVTRQISAQGFYEID